MAILITGGSGFVGLALAEASLIAGDEVVAFGDAPPPPSLHRQLTQTGFQFVKGDVRSGADLQRALRAASIDRVIHAAAVTAGPQREADDPQAVIDINVGGTACLMAILRRSTSPIKRVVAMSSASVYGFSEPGRSGRLREEASCPAPAALYGITKHAAEQTALRLGQVYGIDTRAIRMGSVFGPWEYRTPVREVMSPHLQVIEIAVAGGTALLPRRGTGDWIYSRDAARGIRAVLDAKDLQYPVYNLAGGSVTDLPGWCAAMSQHFPAFSWRTAGADEEPNVIYGLGRDRAPLDLGRIGENIGYQPSFDLALAAIDYAQWMRADREAAANSDYAR